MDFCFFTGIVFLFLLQIFLLFSPAREEGVHTAYLEPLTVAMLLYLLLRIGLPRMPVVLLPPIFAVWHLVSRILNGDWYLRESRPYVYMVLLACCVLFLAPFLANEEQRGKLLRAVALTYSLSFGVIAWIADVAALIGIPWVNPLDGVSVLGINEVYTNPYRLNILDIHPNISAIFFYTSLALLFYLFFSTKKVWIRIAYGVLGAGLCLAIYLTGSISAIIVMGLLFGLAVFAGLMSRKPFAKKRLWLTIAFLLLIAVAVVLSYPLIIHRTEQVSQQVQGQETAAGQAAANGSTEAVFAQDRLEIDSMLRTMNGRFVLYGSAFLSIADRPVTLLIGELWQEAMNRSAKVIHYDYQNHLHNSYLQTLVVGGGISFLLTLAFTVLLAVRGIRLFFGKSVPLHLKMLVLVPFGLLLHSMTEAILFIDTRLPNMLFFFLAGMIIAYSAELCPGKEKRRQSA